MHLEDLVPVNHRLRRCELPLEQADLVLHLVKFLLLLLVVPLHRRLVGLLLTHSLVPTL